MTQSRAHVNQHHIGHNDGSSSPTNAEERCR